MKKMNILSIVILCVTPFISHAVTIHANDFIADQNRDYFNGFEGLPESPTTTTNYVYIENNIKVEQVVNQTISDQSPDIWYAGLPGNFEGNNAWYPNGGDYGYTKISLEDGSDFINIGLLIGTGNTVTTTFTMFELYNDNNLVSSGNVEFLNNYHYLGFSNEIFDTLLLRNTITNPADVAFLDSNINILAIDSIEVSSVPIPPALYLFGSGLIILYRASKNKII